MCSVATDTKTTRENGIWNLQRMLPRIFDRSHKQEIWFRPATSRWKLKAGIREVKAVPLHAAVPRAEKVEPKIGIIDQQVIELRAVYLWKYNVIRCTLGRDMR